jgi:hypothetical protein
MIRITLLAPLLGMTAFGGYYRHWDTAHDARNRLDPHDPFAVYAQRDGGADAERDLARGERRLLTYGEPIAWQNEYSGMLNRIYHIELKPIAEGEVNAAAKNYTRAYNGIMQRDIAHTFGPAALPAAREMAQQLHGVNERVRNYVPPL